jgi:DNA polymerase V
MKPIPVNPRTKLKVAFYPNMIPAGFPSPAEGAKENGLDFNEYLIDKPAATFTVRISGESMEGAGIFDGDLAIVDKSCTAQHKNIVIAVVDGEMMLKRFMKEGDKVYLKSEHPNYPNFSITEEQNFEIWGVVTYVIHKTK